VSVLVVDDDEAFLRTTLRGFQQQGMVAHAATCAARAHELAGHHRPALMVIDLRIGEESGLDLIEVLRAGHAGAAIVLLSAYASVATTMAAVRCGADLVMFKPVHPTEILHQIGGSPRAEVGAPTTPSLARAEWEHVNRVLQDCDGNISEAARRLGIYRQSLQRKLRKYSPSS
jgi:two-component system, response regulator RegA